MDTGFFCPECLSECAWISTTRPEYLWCTKCDVRYIEDEALTYKEVQDEMIRRLKRWEEPRYHDYICPNCKSTQRTLLDMNLILGQSDPKLICLNCRERLIVRVPYSAFTK